MAEDKAEPDKKPESFCKKMRRKFVARPLRYIFRAAAALLVMTAIPLTLEWYGYNGFDGDTRNNPITYIDPYARHLTDGEIEMAKEIFGDDINYNHAKIFNRPYMFFLGKANASAMAPNGNIYYLDESLYSDDFSKETAANKRALFMHELTHVWQYQNGRDVTGEAFYEYISHGCDYGAAYAFDEENPRDFDDYNVEQQAEIIEEYIRNKSHPFERTRVCYKILSGKFSVEALKSDETKVAKPKLEPENKVDTRVADDANKALKPPPPS